MVVLRVAVVRFRVDFWGGRGIGLVLGLEKMLMKISGPFQWMACRPKFLEPEYLDTHRRYIENKHPDFGGLIVEIQYSITEPAVCSL